MIEILNGIRETVSYDSFHGMKLYHNEETENYPLHWHTAMEIIMPVRNEYTVVTDGISHTFQEGDIWVTSPGTLHELIAPPDGERLIILFDYGLVCNLKGMDSLIHSLCPYALISRSKYPELNQTLRHILLQVSEEYDNQMPFTESSIYALMIQFFVAFGRTSFSAEERFPGITTNKQHVYVEKFMNVCNYITDHCTENICVDDLADLAGFSKFHFARLFKQFTGMSCYDYLTRKRIAYAEALLIQPNLSITEVAMRSGFGSLSTFNRIFKNIKNCTPSEYKSLNRIKDQNAALRSAAK
jgi:AraC-like DNA-binding protein